MDNYMNTVAWQPWNKKMGTPGKWSKEHRTKDNIKTLCGRDIPKHTDMADTGPDGDGYCKTCEKVEDAEIRNGTDEMNVVYNMWGEMHF